MAGAAGRGGHCRGRCGHCWTRVSGQEGASFSRLSDVECYLMVSFMSHAGEVSATGTNHWMENENVVARAADVWIPHPSSVFMKQGRMSICLYCGFFPLLTVSTASPGTELRSSHPITFVLMCFHSPTHLFHTFYFPIKSSRKTITPHSHLSPTSWLPEFTQQHALTNNKKQTQPCLPHDPPRSSPWFGPSALSSSVASLALLL